MDEGQPGETAGNGDAGKGQGPALTKLVGILLGLGLLIGAITNQAVKLSNQILPELPAGDVPSARVLIGLVGAVLLLWGLAGLLDVQQRLPEASSGDGSRHRPAARSQSALSGQGGGPEAAG